MVCACAWTVEVGVLRCVLGWEKCKCSGLQGDVRVGVKHSVPVCVCVCVYVCVCVCVSVNAYRR